MMAQGPYGAPPAQGFGDYEFNQLENAIIDKTASRAKLWGTISLVFGVLQLFASCGALSNPMFAAQFPAGVIAIVVGVAFMGVGNSLKSVVQTRGNDVAHMMQALQKLSGAFLVQIVCTIVGVLLIGLFLVLAFLFFAANVGNS